MMITYKRNSNQNFMILEGEEGEPGYEKFMLQENSIPSLLDYHTMEINSQYQFWYEITGKKSLRDFFDQEGVTEENLRKAFCGIQNALTELSGFLITEDHIYMNPDTVFVEQGSSKRVFLCYTPLAHEPYSNQLQLIMEYVVSVVDHHKAELAKLCYEMYEVTTQSQFSITDLISVLEKKEVAKNPVFEERDISEEDIRKAALAVGEDCFEEAEEPFSIFDQIKKEVQKIMEQLFHRKKELFPEEDYLEDIEFDEIVPETRETKTVLLSEDATVCCGKLIHEKGGEAGDYIISHTPFRIGSKAGGNDAVLMSPAVSRYHAKITRQDGTYFLQDLNSMNGTFVNGTELNYNEMVPLKAMDTISFADVVYHII